MSDIISRREVLLLAKKGVLISNDNYKSVCKAINDIPSISEAEGVKIIWDAQIDDLIGKIEKLSHIYLGNKQYFNRSDVLRILQEAKE